jgi:hypothetical protein
MTQKKLKVLGVLYNEYKAQYRKNDCAAINF